MCTCTVEPVLSGHPQDPCLSVCSIQVCLTENKGNKLGLTADIHLMQGVHLIWGPLNTSFTIFNMYICICMPPLLHAISLFMIQA